MKGAKGEMVLRDTERETALAGEAQNPIEATVKGTHSVGPWSLTADGGQLVVRDAKGFARGKEVVEVVGDIHGIEAVPATGPVRLDAV